MSEYQLNKLLFDTAGRHQMVESISDEQELAAYDLSLRSGRRSARATSRGSTSSAPTHT